MNNAISKSNLAPERLTTADILRELSAPVNGWDGNAVPIGNSFAKLCDPILEALSQDFGTIDAIPGYQVLQNLVRAINHVLAGFHLAQHGFLSQANGTLRTALEAGDLAQLCALKPDEAKRWHESKQPWVDFSPSKVRKLIGKPPYDEFHGWLSETGTHSRSVGEKFMGYRLSVADENGNPHPTVPGIAHLSIGPFTDRAGIAFGCLFSLQAAVQIGVNLGMLVMNTDVYSETDWLATMRRIDAARSPLLTLLEAELVAAGVEGADSLVSNASDPTSLFAEFETEMAQGED